MTSRPRLAPRPPASPALPAIALLLAGATAVGAADAPAKDKKPEPPQLLLSLPTGIVPGTTNRVLLRGQRIKDVQSVRITGLAQPLEIRPGKAEDAKVPDGLTAAKAGDQQLELQVVLPAAAPRGTNVAFVAVSPAGESAALPTFVLEPGHVVEESEPNNGFRQAQPLAPGQTMRGVLGDGIDVDVFKVAGHAGRTLRAEVIASRLGSTLDAALTLYDERGTILASEDDGEAGRDPILQWRLPSDGTYHLVLTSVNEKPARTHAYLLQVGEAP